MECSVWAVSLCSFLAAVHLAVAIKIALIPSVVDGFANLVLCQRTIERSPFDDLWMQFLHEITSLAVEALALLRRARCERQASVLRVVILYIFLCDRAQYRY